MPACLLGLGSNLGEREATLTAAIDEIDALPNARVSRRSGWYRSRPLGGPPGQAEFLNAAAVVETSIQPLAFLEHLQRIESRHGRERADRWAARTLDIDLLMYGDEVMETAALVLPHLRMSFRRFVLEPAVEVAAKMVHPVIGWPIERLLLHLDAAQDQAALLSPSDELRRELSAKLVERFGAQPIDRPSFKTADPHWPPAYCDWLAFGPSPDKAAAAPPRRSRLAYAAAAFPKLTILLDASGPRHVKSEWSTIVRQPGRGPTLRLQLSDPAAVESEVFAAIESVWPDLGSAGANRLE